MPEYGSHLNEQYALVFSKNEQYEMLFFYTDRFRFNKYDTLCFNPAIIYH